MSKIEPFSSKWNATAALTCALDETEHDEQVMPWQRKDGLDQWTAVYLIDGKAVANGEPDATVFASSEILANPKMCSLGDEYAEKLRETFDARIVG